jgi:hypothetical protein
MTIAAITQKKRYPGYYSIRYATLWWQSEEWLDDFYYEAGDTTHEVVKRWGYWEPLELLPIHVRLVRYAWDFRGGKLLGRTTFQWWESKDWHMRGDPRYG